MITIWLSISNFYFLPLPYIIITNNTSRCHQHQHNNQPSNTALHGNVREKYSSNAREEDSCNALRKTLPHCNDKPFDLSIFIFIFCFFYPCCSHPQHFQMPSAPTQPIQYQHNNHPSTTLQLLMPTQQLTLPLYLTWKSFLLYLLLLLMPWHDVHVGINAKEWPLLYFMF